MAVLITGTTPNMISSAEALALVLYQQKDYGTQTVPLMQCIGRILATDVKADRDYPPFNRVMMDGIAISSVALKHNTNTFTIQGIQAAGDVPLALEGDSLCIEVMTGAVLPEGADTVIPYEDVVVDGNTVTTNAHNIQPFQNIHKKGVDAAEGSVLLNAGVKLTAAHIGILASVGISDVPVKQLPKVAVYSTGNELVDIDAQPLPHQIRKSNLYMLAALLQSEHITPSLSHLPDDKEAMAKELSLLIRDNGVVILSGAVSKGKYDYLPEVLNSLGMQIIFHRIAQRPGKPMLFGKCPNGTLVFSFPGNPASTFVCYQVYFRAWLCQCLGKIRPAAMARLASTITFKPNLSYHLPVLLHNHDGLLKAVPVLMNNSGDVPSLASIEGLVTLPPEQSTFEEGLLVAVNLC